MKQALFLLTFSLSILSISFSSLGNIPSFKLEPRLKQDFLQLLSKAKDFHTVLEEGTQKQDIQKEIKATGHIINSLYPKISSLPHLHQRLHSYKLLKSLEDHLMAFNSQPLNNKRHKQKIVKKMFKSFFELAEVYNLKGDMKGNIYYCSQDKSTWIQKSGKPKNPINSNHKNCGKKLL